ncbi:hypothetical protein [Naasia sp.]|jgi:hypothetical protein|nr:hypothetical protein [Naasia sp.]
MLLLLFLLALAIAAAAATLAALSGDGYRRCCDPPSSHPLSFDRRGAL